MRRTLQCSYDIPVRETSAKSDVCVEVPIPPSPSRSLRLFLTEQESSVRWSHKEDIWRAQLRDADERLSASQEQCRAERDRVSSHGGVSAESGVAALGMFATMNHTSHIGHILVCLKQLK